MKARYLTLLVAGLFASSSFAHVVPDNLYRFDKPEAKTTMNQLLLSKPTAAGPSSHKHVKIESVAEMHNIDNDLDRRLRVGGDR